MNSKVSQRSFNQLISKLHPTPALGVYPRRLDYSILEELTNSKLRKRYGAPFGVCLPNGDAQVVVAIRNIQWQEATFSLGTGCGIVEESNLDKEWDELALKRSSVRSIFDEY